MPDRNTQPLYNGGNPSFPLGVSPYNSRTEDKNVTFEGNQDTSKNYQFVAYRPGFSLQASELNEMQENMQMQMSLSITMMHNWITSGSGHLWQRWDLNSPSGEGGVGDINNYDSPPNTGIGIGGVPGGGHDRNYVVSGPGWRGATPLYPFASPFQGNYDSTGELVKVSTSINGTTDVVNYTFYPGWYLVESKGWWNGEDEQQPTDVSGLKHWVYLDETITGSVGFIPSSSSKFVVSLVVDTEYVECGSGIGQDADLADNASGVPNSASCGASRYRVSISDSNSIDVSGNWTDANNPTFKTRENSNPIFIVSPSEKTVRYMNNLLIHTWN